MSIPPTTHTSATPIIAFALGGLAGNNFHGAGLLEAALQRGIQPTIVSCTSGQIYWLYEYLQANQAKQTGVAASLKNTIDNEFQKLEPSYLPDLNFLNLFIPHSHAKFRPAFPEGIEDLGSNIWDSLSNIWKETFDAIKEVMHHQHAHLFYIKKFLNNFPARLLVPIMVLDVNKCQQISNEFNNSTIAIIFNSYDPLAGKERIHLNPAAQRLLSKAPGHSSSSRSYDGAGFTANYYVTGNPAVRVPADGVIREYQDITPNSVREALWLYEYGFYHYGVMYLDGAYLRGIILNELAKVANTIYVARPINHKWLGQLPKTLIERFDLETEVFFNGSYFGELDRIQLINELLDNPAIEPSLTAAGFRKVTVIPIEIGVQRGFFDYIFEDMAVFTAAYNQAMNAL